jgi:hypothetical protein
VRRLRLVAVIVAGLVLATIAISAAAQPTAGVAVNVTAYDSHGRRLPVDPNLVAGETVVVVATGFRPLQREQVTGPGFRQIVLVADLQGLVRLVYRVPRGLPNGDNAIVFVAVSAAHVPTGVITPPPATGTVVSPQIGADVPAFALFPFRIATPGGSSSASVSGTSTANPGRGGGGPGGVAVSATTITAGGPAYTGADLLEPLIVGIVGVTAGLVLAVAARRRRAGEHVA